jgi:tetratricopeptide (TPR) repeat protein
MFLSLNTNPVELAGLITALAGTFFVILFAFRTEKLRERLPSLESLDGLMYKTACLAFAGLAMLLITGAIWANESWGRPWGFDSKETGALDRVADLRGVSAHANFARLERQKLGLFRHSRVFARYFHIFGRQLSAAGIAQLRLKMTAGDMYAQIGRYDKAFEFYQKGVELNPKSFEANVQLANAYFDNRQFENAEKYYTLALEINPKDINARTDLGTTFVERQTPDYERGISEFKKVLEIEPNHEPTLYNLGVAYSRMNDAENAQKTLARLEQANAVSPLVGRLRQILTTK